MDISEYANNLVDQGKAILNQKQSAYQITFNPEDSADRQVLADLADFCRATTTTFHPDARIHAVLEGRREVFLRIQKYLNLSPDQLWDLTRKE